MQNSSVVSLYARGLLESPLSAKQQAVLKACLQLFSEKGFDRTSTADIAKLAGVSEGTVYKSFKTKQALLDALLAPIIDDVIPAAAGEFTTAVAAATTNTLEEALRFLVTDRLNFMLANRHVIRIVLQEILVRPELFQRGKTLLLAQFAAGLSDLVTHLEAVGELRQQPLADTFHVVFGLMISYVLPVLLEPDAPVDVAAWTEKIVATSLTILHP